MCSTRDRTATRTVTPTPLATPPHPLVYVAEPDNGGVAIISAPSNGVVGEVRPAAVLALPLALDGKWVESWGEVGVARFWVQTPYRVHLLLRQLYTAHCSATALVSLQYEVSAQVVLSAQGPGGGAAASWA